MIKELIKKSGEVLRNCSLDNGALIAANSGHHVYPSGVANYHYVWPRDASYSCVAADALKLHDIPAKFFRWCNTRLEGINNPKDRITNAYLPNGDKHGVVSYHPSSVGKREWFRVVNISETSYQPDQYGSLLWAINNHRPFSTDIKTLDELQSKLLAQLYDSWGDKTFKESYVDLWEEGYADKSNIIKSNQYLNFTYSIAMNVLGLQSVPNLDERGKQILDEMDDVILHRCHDDDGFMRKAFCHKVSFFQRLIHREHKDHRPDSSLLCLVWPVGLVKADNEMMKKTIAEIEKHNVIDGYGVKRYANDQYSGKFKDGWYVKDGAGAWPLLNFWMAIYFSKLGDKERAMKYFNWVTDKITDGYLPEQIFPGEDKVSVQPLAWSHSMFILACKELGLLENI